MVFFILLFFIFFVGLCEIIINSKSKGLYYLLLVIFILFVGLKSQGGTDFMSYENIFDGAEWGQKTLVEPLFIFICKVCKSIWNNFYFCWFVIAVINMTLKFRVFFRYSPYLSAALLVYCAGLFIERDFDGVRQGLSIALCYMSIPYILKDRFWLFLLCVLCAMMVHATSIIFLLIYPFRKLEIPRWIILSLLGVVFVFAIAKFSIFNIISQYTPLGFLKMKLMQYENSEVYAQARGINIGIIFRLVILILFVYLRNYIKMDRRLYLLLRNGFIMSIVFSLLFHDMEIFSHRLPYVFREFQVLIIPSFLTITRNKFSQILIYTLVFLYALLLIYRIMAGEAGDRYMEYDNWLFSVF